MFVGMAMETIVMAFMIYLLVGGMFDLSVDGTVNMAAVITGALLTYGINLWLAIGVAIASATTVGLVNGFAVTKLKMNPLMTTLGTWWIAQGIAFGITQGISSHSFPDEFKSLGLGAPLGITMPIWYAIILLPLAVWVLSKTRFGYHVYATGGNREASRLHGVKVDRVTIISFVLVALAAALAGVVYAARLNAGVPQTVNGLNLRVIAGAVIGGCSLSGGEGTILGGMLGLLFMTMLTNASVVLGVSPYWQMCILGAVLLIAVGADALAKRRAPSV
jgi:ribose transport system permease protein